jgi:hypothetical protein
MSVDPVGLSGAAVNALIDAELAALAADAQALQAQLTPGDVVQATVLPSNGLTDLVQINGNRVAAALPPSLRPGDVIQVQVTAFDGDQILLQMLEAETPPPSGATPPSPGAAPPATPSGAAPGPPAPPGSAPAAPANPLATASPVPGRAAIPPTAVFVAVAVRAGENLPPPPPAPVAGAPTNVILPPPAKPSAVPFPLLSGTQPSSIEARLAAARTGLPPPTPPAGASGGPAAPPAPSPPASSAPAPPAAGAPPPGARPFVAPPPIAASAVRPAPSAAPAPAATAPATTSAPAAAASLPAPAAGLAAYQEPVALVRALRLPVTPTTVAAAKLALENPQRLPNALATLERALPAGDDPRVATLRSVAAFVGRIDPGSPELASQIASYVEHVVDGFEPKLATLLASQTLAEQAATAPPQQAAAPAASATPAAPASAPSGAPAAAPPAPPEPALPVTILADAAVRAAALVHDLKSALFSILAAPPSPGGDDVTASAQSALTAVTGMQLATANAAAANPQSIAFSIPLWNDGAYQQAHLTVDRDAPEQRGVPLDGDNFHIAFILDTKNLGTVAVDLRTVGRAVTVAVKTEAIPAAERFADALTRLSDRLTHLRYRVAASDAQVARPATAPTTVVTNAPVIPEEPPVGLLDSKA